MEVILLEKIRNLGVLGDKVKVRPGYARNFLIPNAKAVYANEENIAKFEARRAELEKLAKEKYGKALERQKAIEALGSIHLTAKASDEGKLFGSIGVRDITEAFKKAGFEVMKSEVSLPEGTLRSIGEFEISIELESDVSATIKLIVSPEG